MYLELDFATESTETFFDSEDADVSEISMNLILKARRICKMFRKSPLVNNSLQEIVETALEENELN